MLAKNTIERFHFNPTTSAELRKIEKLESDLAVAPAIYLGLDTVVDIFLLSCLKRCTALTKAEKEQLENRNYIAASTLVRPVLDTVLRIYALDNSPNREGFVEKVFKNEPINKMRGQNGKFFSDKNLCTGVSEKYMWVETMYNKYCGWIHLSKAHIEALFSTDKEFLEQEKALYYNFFPQKHKEERKFNPTVYFNPTPCDTHIPAKEFEKVAADYLKASRLVMKIIKRWGKEQRLFK